MADLVGIQPVAMVDCTCHARDLQHLQQLVGESVGGSVPCSGAQLDRILELTGSYATTPGGSVANVLRGMAKLGVRCRLLGVRGEDEAGAIFHRSLQHPCLDLSMFTVRPDGCTSRCAVVCFEGQRTARPCFDGVKGPLPEDVPLGALRGAKWLLLSGYCLYWGTLFDHALTLAQQAGLKVALDLGSKEVVARFRQQMLGAVQQGRVDCCLGNQDEAAALTTLPAASQEDVIAILDVVSQQCQIAVVTRGSEGCMVQRRGEKAVVVPAVEDVTFKDSNGAGDAFASGLLTGLIRDWSTPQCALLGTLCGAAAVQSVGGELRQEQLDWLEAECRKHHLAL